jgi:hypothetical protein
MICIEVISEIITLRHCEERGAGFRAARRSNLFILGLKTDCFARASLAMTTTDSVARIFEMTCSMFYGCVARLGNRNSSDGTACGPVTGLHIAAVLRSTQDETSDATAKRQTRYGAMKTA